MRMYLRDNEDKIVNAMRDYYVNSNAEEQQQYEKDLCQRDCTDFWLWLVSSGLFHDAIGKPVSITKESVTVTTDY